MLENGAMREPYAHNATLIMDADADIRAPGAAITFALCGSWEHKPPCPGAAHHTSAERTGTSVRLRVIFATEPEKLSEVRRRIVDVLRAGKATGPDGVVTAWAVQTSEPDELAPEERAHANRIALG